MPSPTPFADLTLARRLEGAEAHGGVGFVKARILTAPDHGAAWMTRNGVTALFDGAGSPVTQTFGLGLEAPPTTADLEALEDFFASRGSEVCHEVSPLAGVDVFASLAARAYTPIELTSVMFRSLANLEPIPSRNDRLVVRQIDDDESAMFGATAAEGWSEMPALRPFLEAFGRVMATRAGGPCFVAELAGTPIATGVLVVAGGVALLAGASTIPQYRRQGAQLALLNARLRFAVEAGCDLAMICASPGSPSQRNAERHGFRIAYTRLKWQRGVTAHPAGPGPV